MLNSDGTSRRESEDAQGTWKPGAACPRCAELTALVLFGATGDLTRRKLIPAIYALTADQLLPCGLPIISVGRRAESRDQLLDEFREAIQTQARKPFSRELWDYMAEQIYYVRGGLDGPETYKKVQETLQEAEKKLCKPLNRLFYLAIPPHYFEDTIANIVSSGLGEPRSDRPSWPRIVIEKPFGEDLESARELNRQLLAIFDESRIYRMDHYLGKETVQNLLVMRFANSIFEPTWNQKYIANVQITMAETIGLEGRGQYFDKSGMLRDVVQNHLLELLSLTAMEPPTSMDADAVRDEKSKLLRSVRPIRAADVQQSTLRAQYAPGRVSSEDVPGYLQEKGVAEDSQTETYAAVRLFIDNWRWAGVPFFIRAGKRLRSRVTQIAVRFRQAPHVVFGGHKTSIEPNTLILRIQPNEGIHLCFSAKEPGPGLNIQQVPMDFYFASAFKNEPPEAYERLILDSLLGDSTLFARADGIEKSWELMMPILDAWRDGETPMRHYQAGTWGPAEAGQLVAPHDDGWLIPMGSAGECEATGEGTRQ